MCFFFVLADGSNIQGHHVPLQVPKRIPRMQQTIQRSDDRGGIVLHIQCA